MTSAGLRAKPTTILIGLLGKPVPMLPPAAQAAATMALRTTH
jgi:hypothetical protein